MIIIPVLLVGIVIIYVISEMLITKNHEAKGICKTSGGTCTSKVGCTCSDDIEAHE